MNVDALNAVTGNSLFEPKRLEARLRALAANVIQESRVVHGRGALPFTDDDAQRLEAVFGLLHVEAAVANPEYEHYPLVADQQAKPNPALDKIADLLAGDLGIREDQPLTVTAQPVKKVVKG